MQQLVIILLCSLLVCSTQALTMHLPKEQSIRGRANTHLLLDTEFQVMHTEDYAKQRGHLNLLNSNIAS